VIDRGSRVETSEKRTRLEQSMSSLERDVAAAHSRDQGQEDELERGGTRSTSGPRSRLEGSSAGRRSLSSRPMTARARPPGSAGTASACTSSRSTVSRASAVKHGRYAPVRRRSDATARSAEQDQTENSSR